MHFTLRQLDIFAAVMATGQIRGAATRLHLSQAAVSQAVAELADALDVTLFERRGRALVATPAAYRLAELSAAPRAELAQLSARLHGHAEADLAGPVHIAASSTIARYLLPPLVADLADAYPALSITLTAGNTAGVAAQVADGQADLGLIEGPPERDDLSVYRWRTDALVIIAAANGPQKLHAEQIPSQRWVMREAGSGTRRVFEQALALAGIAAPAPRLIIDDAGAQVRTVAAGAGLACVSEATARSAALAGDIRVVELVDGPALQRPLWMISKRRSDGSLLAERLRQHLA